MLRIIRKLGLLVIGLAGLILIAVEIYVLFDLRIFEWSYLAVLIGLQGLAIFVILQIGLLVLTWRSLRGKSLIHGQVEGVFGVVWLIAIAWLLEWMFMEEPVTVRIKSFLVSEMSPMQLGREILQEDRDLGGVRSFITVGTEGAMEQAAVMYQRILVNRLSLKWRQQKIGEIIQKYSDRYAVDPLLLFYWLYLCSYYGEAVTGPVPFLGAMTGETLRDLVQVHLPWWFVESRLRRVLIDGEYLERVAGRGLGGKLRYALQKATYDVSVEPYDTNLYSDVFLVLTEYKTEFPEVFEETQTDSATVALRESFSRLEGKSLLKPYDQPYDHVPMDEGYYERYREPLITFARATFYKMELDFNFATKVQALVARYYSEAYEHILGPGVWKTLNTSQQAALLAMLRDVYIPNIGRVSYNVYLLPEFNCAPFAFVTSEAAKDPAALLVSGRTWRPKQEELLWAGAAYKLRSLSEIWQVFRGEPLPSVRTAGSVRDSAYVVARSR